MKPTLSVTHLLRHFALFLFIVIFLLTMIRAAYVLWQFPAVLESGAFVDVFVMGLRYDLALIGILLLPAVLFGCFFGMFDVSRAFAKFLVVLFLMLGMLFVILTEFITPYFLAEQGVRPDLPLLFAVDSPSALVQNIWGKYKVPAVIGLVLCLLVISAYWLRLEVSRLLRWRLNRISACLLLVIGPLLCVWAIFSEIDPAKPALSPGTGIIAEEQIINEIALNTGYKTLYSIVLPILNKL